MNKHKWHKEIKAWADGAEIEVYDVIKGWIPETDFYWIEDYEYRIKPQPKETQYLYVYDDGGVAMITKTKYEVYHDNYLGKIKLEQDE